MVGGTTFGYWATGRANSATAPIRTKRMAKTLAKTGRSMKNLAIIKPDPARSRLRRRHTRWRVGNLGCLHTHLGAGDGMRQAADHHPIIARETGDYLTKIAEQLAGFDFALLDHIVLVHHQEIAASLIGPNDLVRHQQGFLLLQRERHPHASEETGQ